MKNWIAINTVIAAFFVLSIVYYVTKNNNELEYKIQLESSLFPEIQFCNPSFVSLSKEELTVICSGSTGMKADIREDLRSRTLAVTKKWATDKNYHYPLIFVKFSDEISYTSKK